MLDSDLLPSLAEVAGAIRRRELSARELLEWQLQRVERLEPGLHCFVARGAEAALERADRLDSGEPRGPLHGVPLSVKDNIDVAGFPTTAGSPTLGATVCRRDAASVRRLLDAGAIVIGKTALYEFAFGAQNDHWPATRNPWRLDLATAGSSAGSAAAVAAGLGFASLASDTGGSIRVPASFCGIVGLRPSAGQLPRTGLAPLSRFDELGPLTRSAEDAAIVFAVLSGRPEAAGRAELGGLRLGIGDLGGAESAVAVAVESLAEVLGGLGARVERGLELELDTAAETLWTLAAADAARHWLGHVERHGASIHPLVAERIRAGGAIGAGQLARAGANAARVSAGLAGVFERIDVLVLPAAPCAGYPLGGRELELGGRLVDVSFAVTRYTPLATVAGVPALVVPCGFDADATPIGAQLIAPAGREELLFRVARSFEAVTGWHRREPPLAAALTTRTGAPPARANGVEATAPSREGGGRSGELDRR